MPLTLGTQIDKEPLSEQRKKRYIFMMSSNDHHFMEHLEELLIDKYKPLESARLFSFLFEGLPTYIEIKNGTPNCQLCSS